MFASLARMFFLYVLVPACRARLFPPPRAMENPLQHNVHNAFVGLQATGLIEDFLTSRCVLSLHIPFLGTGLSIFILYV